jgi:predicted HicB family RNase H-like nuclease
MVPKGKRRLTLDLKEENHKALRLLAAESGKSIKEIVEEAIEKHLASLRS